jgi:hypothetical protein
MIVHDKNNHIAKWLYRTKNHITKWLYRTKNHIKDDCTRRKLISLNDCTRRHFISSNLQMIVRDENDIKNDCTRRKNHTTKWLYTRKIHINKWLYPTKIHFTDEISFYPQILFITFFTCTTFPIVLCWTSDAKQKSFKHKNVINNPPPLQKFLKECIQFYSTTLFLETNII